MIKATKYHKANSTGTGSTVHQVALSDVYQLLHKALKLTENPGKAKVTEFDDLVFSDEDVFGLDVSVDALQEQNRFNHNTENSIMCSGACGCGMLTTKRLCEKQLKERDSALLNWDRVAFVVSR